MPVWHDLTSDARESGELVLLGVIQEQHPDRCRLFAQWKNFGWPILHDPINRLNARAVPMFVAIDEAGVVVDANLTTEEFPDFVKRAANPNVQAATLNVQAAIRNGDQVTASTTTAKALDEVAMESNTAADWIAAGDYRVLWGDESSVATAANRYSKAVELEPKNSHAWFRLGVASRMLFDSGNSPPEDFQYAVNAWGKALDIDPNHYIYRRRIQQYGPRLTKPYPFYDWIQQARADITARGDEPVALTVEPVGAEIASPAKTVTSRDTVAENPDPAGRIALDRNPFIHATATVVPGAISKGEALRVHLQFLPVQAAHWNNEAEPLTVWIDIPEGWQAETPLLKASQPAEPESSETRTVDFELHTPAETNIRQISAYALYYICEDAGGQCLYRRQNITIPVRFRD